MSRKEKMKEFIWKLSGADYIIIRNCSKETQAIFMYTGAFVLLILLTSLTSSFYAMHIIFHNDLIALIFSTFWTFMIGNLYALNLITMNNNSLPQKKITASPLFALALRFFLLALLAIFISKPIEVFIWGSFEQSYLLNTIKSLSPASWLITGLVVIIFFIPVIIKLITSAQSSYGIRKEEIEKDLVLSEYSEFKNKYSQLFAEATNIKIDFEEKYIDPPFNTEKRKRKIVGKGKLIKRLKIETEGKKV
ncbi:MAG: DUF4407 domain-containing protein [Chitinophagales bacterium]|nr:DUF4407 domain-containing protein [Chitinophagales bacterium]